MDNLPAAGAPRVGLILPPTVCRHCGDTGRVRGQIMLPIWQGDRLAGWHATLAATDVSCQHCEKGHALWRTNNRPLRQLPSGAVG